ncbi:MAG: hypothetical protein QOI73_2785 [Solirubrobacteraceae bacterium]|nr:hypothetical protein [Solirubrobacteraceae bacterium]
MLAPRPRAVAGAVAASLALAGSAVAAGAVDTTIGVSPRVLTSAPAVSPADFAGVSKVRRGRPLPRNWVVVGRDVRITRGAEAAYAALRMTCPTAKTWRSGASTGDVGATVLDRSARGKHSLLVMATFSAADVRQGETASGTVLALCR